MSLTFTGALMALTMALPAATSAQQESKPKLTTPSAMTLTGCVSEQPGSSGQYTFQDSDGVRQFRLNGRGIKQYAGQHVELVGGSGSQKKLAIRGGLWPSPNVAAQAGALDPAQESIARQPGGSAAGSGIEFPELRVSRLRAVEGLCK